jgi:hypothetical protein
VRLSATRLPVVRLSHSATCQNAPLQGAENVRTTFAIRKLSRRNAGAGIAARPRSRHLDGFVRTGTVRPEASIARALRLSPAHSQRVQGVMAIYCRKYRDSDWCSDVCRERASHARHVGVRQPSTEAAARSASRVHPPPLGGTASRAKAMGHQRPPSHRHTNSRFRIRFCPSRVIAARVSVRRKRKERRIRRPYTGALRDSHAIFRICGYIARAGCIGALQLIGEKIDGTLRFRHHPAHSALRSSRWPR